MLNMNRLVAVAAVVAGGLLVSRTFRKSQPSGSGMPSSVTESIDVDVPVSSAYNQWTQFEDFPKFMEGTQEVRQIDDTHLHWRANVAGKDKEWDSEITEQIPDQRIAWRGTGGVPNAGVVTFHPLSDAKTRVTLQMDYVPEDFAESIGDVLGAVKMEVKSNLQRYKQLLESRGSETGAWRGTVTQH